MEAKVKEWLEKEGFPLEMRAARAFREAGFEIRQSSLFADPEDQKSREIDVVAATRSNIGFTEVSHFIECKSSKHPWVILCADDVLSGFNRVHAFSLLSTKARNRFIEDFSTLSPHIKWLQRPDRCGYGLRKAFSDADVGYGACMSVVKACNARLYENGHQDSPTWFTFTFPIIVVDTPIFECSLAPNEDINLRRVDVSNLLFIATVPNHVATCITVIHIDALGQYAQECFLNARALLSATQPWESLEL